MNGRIERTFTALKDRKRAALIPFIMGYDPDAATTASVLNALAENGADLIEIGMPFSDPMADGPIIQAAGNRALKAGASIDGILDIVRGFRRQHKDTPIIIMGYYNPVYCYGGEKFCRNAVEAGVDGIILVDLPPEEEQEMRPWLDASGLKLIRLIAPTSGDDRLARLAQSATGFVYYISVTGITGARTADVADLQTRVEHLRRFTKLPVAVGFGIKTVQQVRGFAPFSDAVVVGSALVDALSTQAGPQDAAKEAARFITELASGLKR
jgi:tryptophan synthase alpha chain